MGFGFVSFGTVKEVIHQVSHSKKWASVKALDENGEPIRAENGKAVLIPSYSLLQDRFFEHMRNAGFKDFERGVRGSTTQHLSVLDYKIQQDNAKLARIEQEVEAQKATARVWELEDKLTKLFMRTMDFKEAMRLAPERVQAVFAEIFSRIRRNAKRGIIYTTTLEIAMNAKDDPRQFQMEVYYYTKL